MEICDWIPAVLIGDLTPKNIKRSVCAAGHKAMFNPAWQGLPDEDFLESLSPGLGELRPRLYAEAYTSDNLAGRLSEEWADMLGLSRSIAVAVGAFDAHMGAVGAGISTRHAGENYRYKHMRYYDPSEQRNAADIPGVCGIVNGSVMDGYYGIEAGQSAVGDIFLWFINNLVPERYGTTEDEKFKNLEKAAANIETGGERIDRSRLEQRQPDNSC